MKIKTKSRVLVLMICVLFAILYLFVLGQMRNLDSMITKAMIGHRISELLLEAQRSEQNYLRTGSADEAQAVLEDLAEIRTIAGRTRSELTLGMTDGSIKEVIRLTDLYENNFKEVLRLKPEAVAQEENLAQRGIALEAAVGQVLKEIKQNPTEAGAASAESLSAKVDKVTLANKILKEGQGTVKPQTPQGSPRRGNLTQDLRSFLNQKWNEDALTEAASVYTNTFDTASRLQEELGLSLQKLHESVQQLENVILPAVLDLDRKRDDAKKAVMMAIFLAFLVCGLLGLFLSFWLTQIITGPLLRLRNAMLQMAGGDLNTPIDVRSRDEIGELAQSFQAMQSRLKTSYEDLRRTNEKLAEKTHALERSNVEFEQFAHVISHDLKEPIRTVSIYADLLSKHMAGRLNDKDSEYIQYLLGGCKWMYALIDDLLAYATLDSQEKPLQETDAEEALTKALNNLAVVIEKNQAQVTHDPLPRVLADVTRLTQIFQNLIANAVKFRREVPPKIHVAAKLEGGMWVFSVRDNGIGIDSEHDGARVFFIFQRLHTRKEYPGTGMGLAICKKVVDQYGGKIWLESKVGEGSVFYFSVPAVEEASQ